jgi:hypothetical protein
MKIVCAVLLLGACSAANLEITSTGGALADYTQLGGAIICKMDADVTLWETGGFLDFGSDALEMCAKSCNCRQGCISFNWIAFNDMDGDQNYVIPFGSDTDPGLQGACTLYNSNCEGDMQEAWSELGDFSMYAFQKTDKIATDVQALYPRTGAATEKMVTDGVECFLDGSPQNDGYIRVGAGGPTPGLCSSGGRYNKFDDAAQDMAEGGTFASCKAICDASAQCGQFNLYGGEQEGQCKFRISACDEYTTTGGSEQATTYVKDSAYQRSKSDGDGNTNDSKATSSAVAGASVSIACAVAAALLA